MPNISHYLDFKESAVFFYKEIYEGYFVVGELKKNPGI